MYESFGLTLSITPVCLCGVFKTSISRGEMQGIKSIIVSPLTKIFGLVRLGFLKHNQMSAMGREYEKKKERKGQEKKSMKKKWMGPGLN